MSHVDRKEIIKMDMYEKISDRIFSGVAKRFYGEDVDLNSYFLSKIKNNIDLRCVELLGTRKSKSEVDSAIKKAIESFVSSVANDGDLVGVTAAQTIGQFISQTVLKTQHGSGKKQSSNPVSVLTLNRLRVNKTSVKIHISNEQIPAITSQAFAIFYHEYIERHQKNLKELEIILDEKKVNHYFIIENYFAANNLSEYKITMKDDRNVINKFTKLSKIVDNYFDGRGINGYQDNEIKDESHYRKIYNELLAGFLSVKKTFEEVSRQKYIDYFEISEKFYLPFKIDFRMSFSKINCEYIRNFLLSEFEEIKVEDLISPSCGQCKYSTHYAKEDYIRNTDVVFINCQKVAPQSKIFRFIFDVLKIKNSNVNIIDVYQKSLLSTPDVMFTIHPLSVNCFDIVPNMHPDTVVHATIDKILSTKIKGITGLEFIEEISISISDFVYYVFYDDDRNETHVFLTNRNILYFPIEQLLKRITDEIGNPILPKKNTVDPLNVDPFKLVYDGRIRLQPIGYSHYDFIGSIDIDEVKKLMKKYINRKYFITNDHSETMKTIGRMAARTFFESIYMDELETSGNSLNHQNVSLISRHIFGVKLSPITPSGFMKSEGVNAIDKLCLQDHEAVLSSEMIRGEQSETNGLTSSIFFGRKAKMGTNYNHFEEDNGRRDKVNKKLGEASKRKKYAGDYKDINLPAQGQLSAMTELKDNRKKLFVNDIATN